MVGINSGGLITRGFGGNSRIITRGFGDSVDESVGGGGYFPRPVPRHREDRISKDYSFRLSAPIIASSNKIIDIRYGILKNSIETININNWISRNNISNLSLTSPISRHNNTDIPIGYNVLKNSDIQIPVTSKLSHKKLSAILDILSE